MPEITENTTMNDLLGRYLELLDEKEELDALVNGIKSSLADIEGAIQNKLEAEDQMKAGTKVGIEGLTVRVREKRKARYDPDRWMEIVKWATDNGKEFLVQRRLNDNVVMELVDQGVPLPTGLSVRCDTGLSFRRS